MILQLVTIVQWFNPFVYLLGRDLKAVHEYEADSAVLQLGIDAKTYQLLLVTKAVAGRLQTIGNNLSHHSLKKRITMMHKKNSNRWLIVILPILMAMAVVAFAKQKTETVPLLTVEEATVSLGYKDTTPVYDDKDKIHYIVEVMPEFPGGVEAMYKWIFEHLKYPEEAVKNKVQGRVFVQFVVEKDGTITQAEVKRSPNDLLSEEALRVVKLMPKWEPGKVGGKPVRTVFNLPIFFRLPGK
jgi:TonB family protein